MNTQAPSPSISQLRDQVAHLEQSLEDARGHLHQLQSETPAGPDPAQFDSVAELAQARAAYAASHEEHELKKQSASDLITELTQRLNAKRAELAQAEASANIAPGLSKFLDCGRRFKRLMAEAEACFAELEKEADWLLSEGYAAAFPISRRPDYSTPRRGPLTVQGWKEWPYVLVNAREVAICAGDYARYLKLEDERNANQYD